MARGTILTTVTKKGKKRYRTVIRINGKQQWRTWDRKGDAEDYLDELSPDVRDQTYREIKKATFGEYVGHWQATHLIPENFKPSTYGGYRSIVAHHLLPEFRNYPMQAISPAEINAFAAKLLKADASRKTVRNVLNLLGGLLADAKKDHYLRLNPMPDVDKPQTDKEQKGRALKPDEIQGILKTASGMDGIIIGMAIATGLRRGEQFGLGWEHIDFENNVVKVRRELYWKFGKYYEREEGEPKYTFTTPKSKKSMRDVDMSPELRKQLLELYMRGAKSGLVFCTAKGTPMQPDNFVKRNFARILEKADAERAGNGQPAIGKVRWHDLRHTFGSLKIDQGENIYYIMRQMGHSSIQVTIDIYGHQLESRNPEAAAKTDSLIFGEK